MFYINNKFVKIMFVYKKKFLHTFYKFKLELFISYLDTIFIYYVSLMGYTLILDLSLLF
jgi:hypothetical protein